MKILPFWCTGIWCHHVSSCVIKSVTLWHSMLKLIDCLGSNQVPQRAWLKSPAATGDSSAIICGRTAPPQQDPGWSYIAYVRTIKWHFPQKRACDWQWPGYHLETKWWPPHGDHLATTCQPLENQLSAKLVVPIANLKRELCSLFQSRRPKREHSSTLKGNRLFNHDWSSSSSRPQTIADASPVANRGFSRTRVVGRRSPAPGREHEDVIEYYFMLSATHYFLCNIRNTCSELLVIDTLLCNSMICHCSYLLRYKTLWMSKCCW